MFRLTAFDSWSWPGISRSHAIVRGQRRAGGRDCPRTADGHAQRIAKIDGLAQAKASGAAIERRTRRAWR
jgi:hypothetical protein